MRKLVDKADKVADEVKGAAKKIKKTVEFILTPVGQVIGIIVLVLFLIVVVYVISETVQHAIGMWLNDDYAGIATTGDYDTIVGGITHAGYDSFVSEEKWQEYAAFEYAVMMDVAEHIYEYQDYVTEKEVNGKKYYTSAVFPEGTVTTQYDAYDISKEKWREMVVSGQDDGKPSIENTTQVSVLGGNRDVTTPRLIYEIANHEYESDATSLMPYVVVVREDLTLNYFLKGLSNWNSYGNLTEIAAGDLTSVDPVRYSAELNRYNYNLPNSAYKKDLLEDQNGKNVIGIEDKEGFIEADRDNVGYGSDVYYTEDETNIVYKIPLKLLINRYLPKSTLLTTWYMLKKDDTSSETAFKIDDLMAAIKEVYNAACYEKSSKNLNIETITTAGKKDTITGEIKTEGSGITLRTGTETLKENEIKQAVQYDEYGAIKRDEDGKAILDKKDIEYAKTNKRTFIYFEQFGLETTRYEKYKAYHTIGDEDEPNAKSPAATYLTRDRVNFVQDMNVSIKVNYINGLGIPVWEYIDLELKPTYSHVDEPDLPLDEKLKTEFILQEPGTCVAQVPPYGFMKEVVERAEEKVGDQIVYECKLDEEGHENIIYNHYFINKLYMIADVGKLDNPYEKIEDEIVSYKLPEDFRYYNQDNNMPHWYDLKAVDKQGLLESSYLEALQEICADPSYTDAILDMLRTERPELNIIDYDAGSVKYTYNTSATLYGGDNHVSMARMKSDVLNGNYRMNYYWMGVYTIEEKELQIRQTVHHVRMPALLVKYCDFWAKSVQYNNSITQNPIDYKNYKHLIPNSVTSLGLVKMNLAEIASYRVDTFKKFFNKSDASKGAEGIKEGDVLDMLIQWEEYANKGRR